VISSVVGLASSNSLFSRKAAPQKVMLPHARQREARRGRRIGSVAMEPIRRLLLNAYVLVSTSLLTGPDKDKCKFPVAAKGH
jgi:hypothetical protein